MKLRRYIIGTVAVALGGILLSADLPSRRLSYPQPVQQPAAAAPVRPDVVAIAKPADAVALALVALQSIPPEERCYQRFLWLADGKKASMKVASLTLNYVSRGSVIVLPAPLANGHLLRMDVRWYAPQEKDLKEWLAIWESFSFDPTFNLLVTKDSLEFGERLAEVVTPAYTKTIEVTHGGGPYVYPDDSGRRHDSLPAGRYTVDLEFGPKKTKAAATVDVLRFNAPYLPAAMVQLQEMTHSLAPIVESRYFLTRALSTIRDKGVFREVFGGLYYDLRGIKKSTVKGATDLDVFFESLGIGNIKAGITQERLFDSLRSDQRLAVFRSDITGKPREVSSFHTPADREGGSFGAITGDIKDADVDVGDRSFANLLAPRRAAREAIFPTRNGLSIFALFNGAGELQDEVPPDIAIDSTIPSPYTRRLQPAIGCLRCHGTDGSDGWKPLVNDVKRLTAGRLDIFGDLSRGRRVLDSDTIDRLAGLYAGDFGKALRRARDDVAEVTLRATGPWRESETQADVARLAAQALADQYHDFNYTLIDARAALRDAGLDVNKAKAVDVFKRLMQMSMPDPSGVYLEKPTIAFIAQGGAVLRADFALVFPEVMGRVQNNLAKVKP